MAEPYSVIYADPPWTFATCSQQGKGRSAEAHYDCLTIPQIKEFFPLDGVAAENSVLFLWTTDPHLPMALEVMAAWGFLYKTIGFVWAKTTIDGSGFPIGTGYYTRANPEICLLGTRGKPQRLSRSVRKLIVAPRREHSRKPDEAYTGIEALFAWAIPRAILPQPTARLGSVGKSRRHRAKALAIGYEQNERRKACGHHPRKRRLGSENHPKKRTSGIHNRKRPLAMALCYRKADRRRAACPG